MDIAKMLAKVPPFQQTFYAVMLSRPMRAGHPNYGLNILAGLIMRLIMRVDVATLASLIGPVNWRWLTFQKISLISTIKYQVLIY